MFRIGQVYNDPRIPIIQRYENHWATEEVAKKVASVRRKDAYARGEATPPKKFAYNAANSAKRNPKAPRGRLDSASQSVKLKGKVQRTERGAHNVSTASPEPLDQGSMDIHVTNTRSLAHTTPNGPQDTGLGQTVDPSGTPSSFAGSHH
jgi:hypothetical protein